jgi:cytochrome P450
MGEIIAEVNTVATARPETLAINLPPGPRLPKALLGLWFATARQHMGAYLWKRYGDVFTVNVPVFGRTVMIADPRLAKQLFAADPEDVGNTQPNLSRLLGPGSLFGLEGAEHRARRKLLTPPFHGKSVKNYERIFVEETLLESAHWPDDQPFQSVEPLMRITLNVMLRAVFGAAGEQFDQLRSLMPSWVVLGCQLAPLPMPSRTYGRYSPWGRLAQYRREFDVLVDQLIDNATADPDFENRDDILSLLLRSSYEDGTAMSRRDIADELLTLLAAGHETTATTLAWALERISRHPDVLTRLEAEAATDDNAYRQATCMEVQRTRAVIDLAGRHVYAPKFQLGQWVIPGGSTVVVAVDQVHIRADEFDDPHTFDPQRFLGERPPAAFMPFGGGLRRCAGSAFAVVEMDVILRTILRHFAIEPTDAPGEKIRSRGIANPPKDGARVTMRRRPVPLGA